MQLDDGTSTEISFEDLMKTSAPGCPDADSHDPSDFEGIPYWLRPGEKVTLDHDGAYQKGFIHYSPEGDSSEGGSPGGGFSFVVMRNARSSKVTLSVPLPHFKREWPNLVGENVLLQGWGNISSFLRPNSSNNAPSASHVSAKNLHSPCPPSLIKALHPSNPDRQVWLDSYREEKGGLKEHDTFERISKSQYLALKRRGLVPDALPSMCVLVIKKDKDGRPDRAKSRIVVLGNHEDRVYEKSKRFAPVLHYSSLRLLTSKAVEDRRILQQGDCKNAFCQAELPADEQTVVRPPFGDPAFSKGEYWLLRKTLYGLQRSPRHWYDMFTSILRDLKLEPSPHDPCLYSGVVNDASHTTSCKTKALTSDKSSQELCLSSEVDHSASPSASPAPSSRKKLYVGIYVDDFVFYSADPAEEDRFRAALADRITVEFMGDVDYFLGTAFTWRRHASGHLSVHLCQSAFAEYTAHRFGVDKMNQTPNMTPYCSGYPIDAIPPPDPKDPDLKRRTKVYQSIVGSLNWLATCSRPDIAPVLTFLASYLTAPHGQHCKAAIHALRYVYSTCEYGISFHSDARNTLQAFNHFPHHHDKEAYTDATPPSPSESHQLTAFSDACWGGQFGNVVPDGTPLELFKFRSLSGYVICRCGGPIAWKSIRQNRTALSSCQAEIVATNECVVDLLSVKLRMADLDMHDAHIPTKVYNDNQAAVQWTASLTSKGIKYINLRETMVREAHLDNDVIVTHIPGVINSSDLFTKEIKSDAHFRRLRDSMMVSKANFLKHDHNVPSHMTDKANLPYYSIRASRSPEEVSSVRRDVRVTFADDVCG